MKDQRPITNVIVTGITPKGYRVLALRGWRASWYWWWVGLYKRRVLNYLPRRFRNFMADLVLEDV